MTPVVDLAVGELQPGVLAVTSASPPEPASRRNRVAVIAALVRRRHQPRRRKDFADPWLCDADENAQAGVAEQGNPGAGASDGAQSQLPASADKDNGRRDGDQHSAERDRGGSCRGGRSCAHLAAPAGKAPGSAVLTWRAGAPAGTAHRAELV